MILPTFKVVFKGACLPMLRQRCTTVGKNQSIQSMFLGYCSAEGLAWAQVSTEQHATLGLDANLED